MIDELHATDVALIRDARIQPADGLTVLTGETGAGKTALLGALKLLVGERADASLVREGADALVVEGRVFLAGGDPDGSVVRRRVSADGRGRVDVDGSMASVRELAATVGATVDLCGQHEHQKLLQVASHVEMLDAYAGEPAAAALAAYRDALAGSRAAAAELERVREMGRASGERLDEARFVLGRIDAVGPSEEELAELEAQLPRAEHAEALWRAAEEAREAIGGDEGALDLLSGALSELRGAASHDPVLGEHAEQLQGTIIDLEDLFATLRDYRDAVDLDPESLQRMQERMAELRGIMRSYGPSMADVLERRAQAAELVQAASDDGARLRAAERAVREAEAALAKRADELDAVRTEAAPRLAQAITHQMERLEMGTASVELAQERMAREEWGAAGPSRIELMYRPGAGMSARPLRRIASGGEISRVMLAAKVVLGEADNVDTLVFDEVDAGVGGATAVALAQVIADLARTHQVIVVTHLAQVAVVGERHYVVRRTGGDVPETQLCLVEGEERVREIARMLSGDATEASLAHAREMLAASAG